MLIEFLDWLKGNFDRRVPASLTDSGNLRVSIEEATTSSSGGLTDTELRATPVPVDIFRVLGATMTESNPIFAQAPASSSIGTFWDSSTAVNTQLELLSSASHYGTVGVEIVGTVPGITSGTVRFESGIGSYVQAYVVKDDFTIVSNFSPRGDPLVNVPNFFLCNVGGQNGFRVVLDTAIVGTGGISITIRATPFTAALPTGASVVATTPSLTTGQYKHLSQTPEGRLRVDLEATSRDVGGVTVIDTADRQARRLQEQLVLEAYEQSIRNLFLADSETSHRMGFEVR